MAEDFTTMDLPETVATTMDLPETVATEVTQDTPTTHATEVSEPKTNASAADSKPWTDEEDALVLKLVATLGPSWNYSIFISNILMSGSGSGMVAQSYLNCLD